jgi:hypothetical protein
MADALTPDALTPDDKSKKQAGAASTTACFGQRLVAEG